jgi:hypothetical protein
MAAKKTVVKGLKETKGLRQSENKTTADDARKANARALAKKVAAKKANPMKNSARSHQGDLAKVSGSTAAANKAAAMRKAKNTFGIMDQTGAAKTKAERRTLKSFK